MPAENPIRIGKKALFAVRATLLTAALSGATYKAYEEKDLYTPHMADASRRVFGDEQTAKFEKLVFSATDKFDKLKFKIVGSRTNPFAQPDPELDNFPWADSTTDPNLIDYFTFKAKEPPKPAPLPLTLPETTPLRANLEQGEGVWTTVGLPRTSPEDMMMAKTFIRPDTSRPYALVGVLLLDKRRIRLHITGGTEDPGGDRGVKGPGVIPQEDRPNLLAAWNGGFKGPHGGYGMYADGKTYRPLQKGLASVAVTSDGTILMGEWGRDLTWSDDVVAVRQNAVLLVDNCEVSKRTNEGNNTWGYVQVNSAEFITWRSAIGITKNGDLLVAAGNSLSAASLARALWAAGACYAIQLDINTPYVKTDLFFPQDDGSMKRAKFMDSMVDGSDRFMSTQKRDFMFATHDETNYKP